MVLAGRQLHIIIALCIKFKGFVNGMSKKAYNFTRQQPIAVIKLLSRYGQVAGTCKCSNKLLGFIKCGEFLD